jgi:hypothetical protein
VPAVPAGVPSAAVRVTAPVAAVAAKVAPARPSTRVAVASVRRAVRTAPVAPKRTAPVAPKAVVLPAKPVSVVTHAPVAGSTSVMLTPKKVKVHVAVQKPATRLLAANSTGPCSGYPTPPYNCTQMAFDGAVTNFCDGAIVNLTGYFHDMASTSFDPSTMTLTLYEHMNFQNVKGFGTDGNPYTSSDTQKDETTSFPVVPGLTLHFTTTHKEENNLISLGSDPNQIVHVTTTTDVDVDAFTGIPTGPPVITMEGPGFKCTG